MDPTRRPRRTKAHILVVDDNPAILKLLGTLFEEEGLTVALATSAREAREQLTAGEGCFDLILSDIQMPVETGFDLLQWIKREGSVHAHLPVLLTTAELPEAQNRLKGLAMGAVDYVVRPIELKELVLRSIHAIEHYQRIKALETSLQDSERLAMVGRLLAASNHEIKNLATIVHLTAGQLTQALERRGLTPDSPEAIGLKALNESSALLTEVARSIGSLLDPAARAERHPFNLEEMLRAVVALMGSRVKPHRLELSRSEPGDPCWVLGQDVRIKQVLINLILNAHEAIAELDPPEGGRIRVVWGGDTTTCFIEVTDNGIGLSTPGETSQFAAFVTTKKLRGGQGLGLWLCSSLVTGLGGQLSLSSRGVGAGATARVVLPRCDAPAAGDLDLEAYLLPDDAI